MNLLSVAPHVGAWIEMLISSSTLLMLTSHPTWVRGLKYLWRGYVVGVVVSHPTWVRGLKSMATLPMPVVLRSHPTWVRGLKLSGQRIRTGQSQSHPTWVRGLKFPENWQTLSLAYVAPHVGAWIEIQVPTPSVTRPAQAALPRTALWIASRAVTSC